MVRPGLEPGTPEGKQFGTGLFLRSDAPHPRGEGTLQPWLDLAIFWLFTYPPPGGAVGLEGAALAARAGLKENYRTTEGWLGWK